MKQKVLTLFNVILVAILGLFGFTACNNDEYGCPEADYYAEGYVLDEEGAPIEGITVKYGYSERFGEFYASDSAKTNDKGKYLSATKRSDNAPSIVTMVAVDNSGVYANDTVKNVESKKVKRGDGDWYEGTFKFGYTFHLKKKQ